MPRFDGAALTLEYGDVSFVRELASLVLTVLPGHIEAIRTAVASENASTLRAAAHRIRGSISAFHADSATESARQLEALGASGDLTGADVICAALVRDLQELCDDAAAWLKSGEGT